MIYFGNLYGVIIEVLGEKFVYYMGDIDIFFDMVLINEMYKLKIGLVLIGDCFIMGGKFVVMVC